MLKVVSLLAALAIGSAIAHLHSPSTLAKENTPLIPYSLQCQADLACFLTSDSPYDFLSYAKLPPTPKPTPTPQSTPQITLASPDIPEPFTPLKHPFESTPNLILEITPTTTQVVDPLTDSLNTPSKVDEIIDPIMASIVVEAPKPVPAFPLEPQISAVPDNQLPLPNLPDLDADLLFDLVNQHRSSKNLPPFQKHPDLCSIATVRAPQISQEISLGRMHQGFKALNLGYRATENIISNQSETGALAWWLNSNLHRRSIEGDYLYSCTACVNNTCAQVFSNFAPKPATLTVTTTPTTPMVPNVSP